MGNKNDGISNDIKVLTVVFSIMSFIGTMGLFSYFGNTTELDSQVIAFAGVCIAGSIGLAILLLIRVLINLKD